MANPILTLDSPLIILYARLIGWTLLGYVLGRLLPKVVTTYLGRALLFVGVPIANISFLRQADLSGWIVIAPTTAWIAIIVGAGLAWIWIDLGLSDEKFKSLSRGITLEPQEKDLSISGFNQENTSWSRATQGSFLLAMTLGNTSFMGYPISLALIGTQYFAWSLFYDLIGSTLASYSVGVALASRYGSLSTRNQKPPNPLMAMAKTPALWSLPIGVIMRFMPLSDLVVGGMSAIAWTTVTLALVMIGMQLSQLKSIRGVKKALICLTIKMILTPLVVGTGLMFFGVTGEPRMALVLQMAMPPAFSTLVIAQAYNLDRDLTVTTLAIGVFALLFTIPIWLWLFS